MYREELDSVRIEGTDTPIKIDFNIADFCQLSQDTFLFIGSQPGDTTYEKIYRLSLHDEDPTVLCEFVNNPDENHNMVSFLPKISWNGRYVPCIYEGYLYYFDTRTNSFTPELSAIHYFPPMCAYYPEQGSLQLSNRHELLEVDLDSMSVIKRARYTERQMVRTRLWRDPVTSLRLLYGEYSADFQTETSYERCDWYADGTMTIEPTDYRRNAERYTLVNMLNCGMHPDVVPEHFTSFKLAALGPLGTACERGEYMLFDRKTGQLQSFPVSKYANTEVFDTTGHLASDSSSGTTVYNALTGENTVLEGFQLALSEVSGPLQKGHLRLQRKGEKTLFFYDVVDKKWACPVLQFAFPKGGHWFYLPDHDRILNYSFLFRFWAVIKPEWCDTPEQAEKAARGSSPKANSG
ncbi:MAG: hypothetical protein U5N86_00515 [Planctomycetota bacterium]|nr:hypothetical protein [Planctomycetota bacterium]